MWNSWKTRETALNLLAQGFLESNSYILRKLKGAGGVLERKFLGIS